MTVTYGDRIFRLVQQIERNVNKPDLHSFTAKIKNGVVWVEARAGEIYISEMRCDTTHIGWAGNAIAAANRLEALGIDLESVAI